MFKAFFFDMDGVLFDSMPTHARAWSEVMNAHGLPFTPADAYRNEGRTGQSVIREIAEQMGRTLTEEDIRTIYAEKAALFQQHNDGHPMAGIHELLDYLTNQTDTTHDIPQIWIVTGSGQQSLFDRLQTVFPEVFHRDRMITAYDVRRGKPDPEPYLMAWERSGLSKSECCVVENAPLGVRAGKAAGLFTFAVNTGPLPDCDLKREGADVVLSGHEELLRWLREQEE